MRERATVIIQARLTASQAKRLQEMSEATDIPLSRLIRQAVGRFVRRSETDGEQNGKSDRDLL
jgi:predicted transcriptional regulator